VHKSGCKTATTNPLSDGAGYSYLLTDDKLFALNFISVYALSQCMAFMWHNRYDKDGTGTK